jgi:hypothetical protein
VFNLRRRQEPNALDPVIEDLVSELKGLDGTDENYRTAADNLKILLEAKALEPRKRELDPNTIAVVAGNIAGIVMILMFEMRGNVIASKALTLINKPKP